MSWMFLQMDLVQYKVLHMTFELIRILICISAQVIKHLRNWSKPRKCCASFIQFENWL